MKTDIIALNNIKKLIALVGNGRRESTHIIQPHYCSKHGNYV